MANMNATASSAPTTRNIVRVKIKEQKGTWKNLLSTNMTKIYNHSERDIFLIPILTTAAANARKAGRLESNYKEIKAEDSIEVDFGDYEHTSSGSFIRILFRATNGENVQKVLDDFHRNGSEEETLHVPNKLKSQALHLQCNEVNIVKAGQIKSMRGLIMDIKAKQENLKKDVEDLTMDQKAKQEKLKKDVEDLLTKTVALLEALTRVER